VHFGAFTRLFTKNCLPKPCAVVADADLDPCDATELFGDEDEPTKPDIAALEGDYVRAFLGSTTFEREITVKDNLKMLSKAASELGAVRVAADLDAASKSGKVDNAIKDKVLRTAIRFGKARFAQVAARHVEDASDLPEYIMSAVLWLL
jgi:putative ATP-dependent endonuclease of OLD family